MEFLLLQPLVGIVPPAVIFKVWAFNKDPSTNNFIWPQNDLIIVVQRFYHLWNYLEQLPDNYYRYVISTDVKDVIFQNNPSKWLENNLGKKDIVASCESLLYKDEEWGNDNLQGSYPMVYNKLKEKPIWNCGVQAGRMQSLKELWLNIWLLCKAAGRYNPDQAAYNLLLNTKAWSNITKFAMSEDAFSAQLGTTMDPLKIKNFKPHLLESQPIWNNGKMTTSTGLEHTILHQWDRIPDLLNEIEKLYG